MKVLFRLNAGKKTGLGHLARNVALALEMSKRDIAFNFLIKCDDSVIVENFLRTFALDISNVCFISEGTDSESDISLIRKYLNPISDFLIIDHYDHDLLYQKKLKESGIKWAQFDYETSKQIFANVVVNSNVCAQSELYKHLVSDNARLCVGPEYAIIREEFLQKKIRPIKNSILIALGGANYPEEVIELIKYIVRFTGYTFNIVSRDLKLKELLIGLENVNLYINENNVYPIYVRNEVAIVAGGVTTYELAVLDIPMFIVPYVENQLPNAQAWHKKFCGINYEAILHFRNELALEGLGKMISQLQEKYLNRTVKIDGKGAVRIVNEILKAMNDE